MFMETSMQNSLCQGLRAVGIPKKLAYQVLNTVVKWHDANGPEWTNQRIKDFRQWYETCLTGEPKPPSWFKHDKHGYPLGIWKAVFKLPIQKALGVLAMNTVYIAHELLPAQEKKFLEGIAGTGSTDPEMIDGYRNNNQVKFTPGGISPSGEKPLIPKRMKEITSPTVFDMNGSVPIQDCQTTIRPSDEVSPRAALVMAKKALEKSWESIPQVTFDFLLEQGLEGLIPMSAQGNQYQLEWNKPHSPFVGKVSVLQEPQFKARVVCNTHRVTQKTLDPLRDVYMNTLKRLPTDVIHDQNSGVLWTQQKLAEGITLAGSDLTSASDLLDLELSLKLVDDTFGFPEVPHYSEFRDYFIRVSRNQYAAKDFGGQVSWAAGDPLGTGPSIGLLSLTNNACALCAWSACVAEGQIDPSLHPWSDSFRVLGDDIIMLAEMEGHYTRMIESLGGLINHTKTLKSDKVAEFAGRVITPTKVCLKAIHYCGPSDQSFMEMMSILGDQAKCLLRPRQRKVYDLFREVPGVAVAGPWNGDSFGIPLSDRYQWYLEEVQPVLGQLTPDLELQPYTDLLLKIDLAAAEANSPVMDEIDYFIPLLGEGYLPSRIVPAFKVVGDPRLTQGKTQLEVLYQHLMSGKITPFKEWKIKNSQNLAVDLLAQQEAEEVLKSPELKGYEDELSLPVNPGWQVSDLLAEAAQSDDTMEEPSFVAEAAQSAGSIRILPDGTKVRTGEPKPTGLKRDLDDLDDH